MLQFSRFCPTLACTTPVHRTVAIDRTPCRGPSSFDHPRDRNNVDGDDILGIVERGRMGGGMCRSRIWSRRWHRRDDSAFAFPPTSPHPLRWCKLMSFQGAGQYRRAVDIAASSTRLRPSHRRPVRWEMLLVRCFN
jgi:hypothetical protein